MNSSRHQRWLALPRGRRLLQLARSSRFEHLEDRVVLDAQIGAVQIGSVTMPYDGYLSAAVYDANGQIVRTLLAQTPEQIGVVSLMWDGKDEFGRTVVQDGTYTWKALTSQVVPVDEGGVGDSEFLPDLSAPNQGYNLQSLATSQISGTSGDVGGAFARTENESYFGDTSLTDLNGSNPDKLDLSNTISASGKFFFTDIANMGNQGQGWAQSFIGHFSSSTANDRREFIGLEFYHNESPANLFVRARIYGPTSDFYGGVSGAPIPLPVGTGYYDWDYTYDPADQGTLTLHVYNNAGVNQTVSVQNVGITASFDAFGMGISTHEANTGNNPALYGKIFMDDVTYSGHAGLVDFNGASAPSGWIGSGGNIANGNAYGWNSYSNSDGSLYTASYLEESGEPVARIGGDGTWQWGQNAQLSIGIAADEKYVYASRHEADQDRLYRYFSRDGGLAPFAPGVNYLVINSSAPETLPPTQAAYHYTPEQWRTLVSTWGIAADGSRIWISNYRNNRVEVYDRNTGALLGQFAVNKPVGITVDTASAGASTVWVANNGDRVTKITFNGGFTASTSITGLSDPTGVTIGGPNHHLFVAESGLTRIDEYDVSGAPVLAGLQHFGSKSLGGPVTDTQFYWTNTFGNLASLAIDPTGILSVNDDHRVQRFYTVTGGGHTAGDLHDTMSSEFAPAPTQAYNFTTNGKHYLVSGRYVYEVDPEYTGGPRTGWLGDGTWRLVERYNFGVGEESGYPGLKRTIMDGTTARDFYFQINGHSVIAYSLEPNGQRQAAIVGVDWSGPDRMNVVPVNSLGTPMGGRYNWIDTDGDGLVDWNGIGSGSDGEVTWNIPFGQYSHLIYTAPWVDDLGNIWYGDAGNLFKVPFEGFATATNGKRNPIYNWAHQVIVVPFHDDQYDFTPYEVRIAANGDIYALGSTTTPAGAITGVNGADWIAIYNSAGVRQFLAPSIDNMYAGLAIDQTDPDPDYYFTGETQYASMFTKDGLLVARFTVGAGNGAPTGWMDHSYSISAFTHPITGVTYVYGEEVFYGKSIRWRLDNLSTIERQQGTFAYSASKALSGHWEFDGKLNDAVSNNTGTFSGGSPSYLAGQVGSALDLDGTDDYVTLPYASDFNGYSIAAWVKPTDTTFVNIISYGSADANYLADQIRINAQGKFEHYTFDGFTETITGTTTVQPNTWYHVAITAVSNGQMHLYVNGVEQGAAIGIKNLLNTGDRFYVGKSNAGGGFFDGLIDDLRIYETPLSSGDVLAIFNGTALPRVTLLASDATAAEQSADRGTFTIQRDGTVGNLVVGYTTTGTATNVSDYSSLSGFVTILNGQTSATVNVIPIDDAAVEGSESVMLTLTSSANYTIGTQGAATLRIVDNDFAVTAPDGYWPFEDTVPANGTGHEVGLSDYAGANNGTNHGTKYFDFPYPFTYDGPATYASGKIGDAVSLDGADDRINIPYSTDASSYTIALWVKPSSGYWYNPTGIANENIIARTDIDSLTLTNVSEQLRINGSGKFEHYTNDGSGKTVTGTTTVQPNTWYHVAIVATSGGMMRLYVNGQEEGTAQSIGTLWPGGDRFNLGNIGGGMGPYKGLMDDLQIYDAPLSAAQILAIYNQADVVTITATDPHATEPNESGKFTLVRTNPNGDLVVNLAISGTAAGGTDYVALPTSVTIPNGALTATLTVAPINDSVAEGNESVILTITSSPNYFVGTSSSASLTLADDEPIVTIATTDVSAAEQGPDPGTFTVTRSNTSGNLVVHYTITGTATNGTDYVTLPGSVTILAGSTTANVTVTPIADGLLDSNETVILTIAPDVSYNVGAPSSDIVTISDVQSVSVSASDALAAEQGPNSGTFTISRNTTIGSLIVNYTLGGTATNGTDYSLLASSVTIPNGSTTANVTFVPIDDSSVDPDETVILTLTSGSNYVVVGPSNATATIVDNDVSANPTGRWTFDNTLADSAGSHNGTFFGGPAIYASGKFGSALDFDGVDDYVDLPYLNNPNAVTISAWVKPSDVTSVSFLARGSSNIDEGSNLIHINANSKFENYIYATDGNHTLTGTTTVQANTWYHIAVVDTNNGMMRLYVNGIEEGNTQSIGTMWASGDRYRVGVGYGWLGYGYFDGLIDDVRIYEAALSASDIRALSGNAPTTISVSATDADAAEQGLNAGTFLVSRDNTIGALTVFYTITGTATNGTDYSTIAGSVTIPNGSSTATITVTPIDDPNIESSETVILTLSTNANYTIGAPTNATVTIADNDAAPPAATVADRKIFYNNSAWDGNNTAANATDDAAIAPDKSALRANPGQTVTATFANYTSYSKGINGIMVDIAGLPGGAASTISASDFIFKTGNNNTPSGWATPPNPASVTVRAGAGTGGSDRVTLIWTDWSPTSNPANEAVAKAWLQVTVKANATTGLSAADVFFVGNAVGENGGVGGTNTVPGVATVTTADEIHARANPKSLLNPALKDNIDDFNRDKQVNPSDQVLARANQTSGLNGLKLIAVTNPSAAPSMAPLAAPSFAPAAAPSADLSSSAVSPSTSAVAFALTTSPVTPGTSSNSAKSSPTFHTVDVSAAVHRPTVSFLSHHQQHRREEQVQATRETLRDLHCGPKDTLDDDLLEVLAQRLGVGHK